MTYNLGNRLDYLGTRMQELNQNTLTYTRTGSSPITITNFTPERIDVSQLAIYGITLVTEKAQDFIFDTDELSGLANPLPLVNDEIVWGSNTYQVMAIGSELYTFTTSSRQRIRIHTKQVS